MFRVKMDSQSILLDTVSTISLSALFYSRELILGTRPQRGHSRYSTPCGFTLEKAVLIGC